eukprot:TRINITY_DN38953_c0_g1_i1.p1 TRINITY_DN38953_c0_g1~~TRINITY_DN38953_c0_g1_i1.p1  ORF type:complete len:243 (+),score=61.07 TRINITY_DN38953_c0_g1_i1:35-730(+)
MAGGCFGIMLLIFGVSVVAMRVFAVVGTVLCIVGALALMASFATAMRGSMLESLRVIPKSRAYEVGDHISYVGGGRFHGDTYIKGPTPADGGELLIGDEGVVLLVMSEVNTLRCTFPEVQVSLHAEDIVGVDASPDDVLQAWHPSRHAECAACLRRLVVVVLLLSTRFDNPAIPHEIWFLTLSFLSTRHQRKGSVTDYRIPWSRMVAPVSQNPFLAEIIQSPLNLSGYSAW